MSPVSSADARFFAHVDLDGLSAIHRAHGREGPGGRDDFYLSAVENALAFFADQDVTATFFVIAEDLDDPDKLDAVRDIVSAEHRIASHGWHHRTLYEVSSDEKRREVVDSKERIESVLGVACDGFRAPGYSADLESLELAREAGYLYDSSLYPTYRFRSRLGVHRILPEPFRFWPGDDFFEVPLPDSGPFLPPFHPAYAFYLRGPYFRWRLRSFADRHDHLTLLFHLTDFAERTRLGADLRLQLFANNLFSGRTKLRFLRKRIEEVRRHFRPAVTEDVLDGWPESAPRLAPRTVLGVSTTHETGACLVRDGEIAAAVSEERMSRRKLDTRYPPEASIREVIRVADVAPEEIEAVAVAGLDWRDLLRQSWDSLRRDIGDYHGVADYVPHLCRVAYRLFYLWRACRYDHVRDFLRDEYGIDPKMFYVEHHEAHAASVYRTSGWSRGLVVTADGVGDEISLTVSVADGSLLRRVETSFYPHSFGQFYTACTQMLGFKGGRHEGKITGLSGHGSRDGELLRKIEETLREKNGSFRLDKRFYAEGFVRPNRRNLEALLAGGGTLDIEYRNYKRPLRRRVAGHDPEDVAWTFQHVLEREMVRILQRHWSPEHRHLGLAGGVFANVKLNMALSEALSPGELFVFPAMGDGGLCVGAALSVADGRPEPLRDVYLGTGIEHEDSSTALAEASGVSVTRPEDMAGTVARALADGRIVARCDGRMEFGPRALGNRSILFHCGDPSVNDWLNRQLDRTEFMPFAPICLYEDAERYFDVGQSERRACEYMTLVVRCTDLMKRTCPAAVHVDGTARPQLVRRETNPGMYEILARYRDLTGVSCLINTSLNMHEEPIVRTPGEALAAFRQSSLDLLVLGGSLVEAPGVREGRPQEGDSVDPAHVVVAR